jgi:small subunit ribosomal protein S5
MTTKSAYEQEPKVNPDQLNRVSERVIMIRRVSKVTAGGKHMRFNALVAVGDGEGHVGIGMGKAEAVPDAIRKGTAIARRRMIAVLMRGGTIPHDITSRYSSSQVLLRPAVEGTGVVAGTTLRSIIELAGITDVLSKAMGNTNPINLAKATMEALTSLRDPETELAQRKASAKRTAQTSIGRRVRN